MNHTTIELETIRDALVQARLEAAEWKARAEERADRITELATRAEAAEARLDRMITSQTALALTLKNHQQQLTAERTPSHVVDHGLGVDAQEPVQPEPSEAGRATSPVPSPPPAIEHKATVTERFRAWRAGRRIR